MRRLIYVPILLLYSLPLFGQKDTTKVLFIGNSFTYVYDVPGLLKGFADKAGFPLKYAMHAPGGTTVGDTSQGDQAHMYNPVVFNLIRSDAWNFVSLQDNQGRFIYGHKKFPDTAVSKVIEGHFKIRDSVKFYHPCARMLWYAGWAFQGGYPGIAATGKELIDNIYENYTYLKDTAGEIVSPIGIAWERAMVELPGVNLWGPDSAHQSLAGSYLNAAVLFTSIFRINTERILYTGGLDSTVARTLRRIAYQTVIDSIAPTNLGHYIPSLDITGSQLIASPGYISYKWYLSDSLIETSASNTLDIVHSGCYQVTVTGGDACTVTSVEKCVDILQVVSAKGANNFKIYPVPATDFINIEISNLYTANGILTIADAVGRTVKEMEVVQKHITVPIGDLPGGLYYVTLQTEHGIYRGRILKGGN